MKVNINVSQEYIDSGVRRDAGDCPVAHAITFLLKEGYYAVVGGRSFSISSGGVVFKSVSLPEFVDKWVTHYDDEGHGLPFEFDVEIPDQYLKEEKRKVMTMREFIRNNRKEIDAAIRKQVPDERLNDENRRLWVLNDEPLYLWARAEQVDEVVED